MTRRSGQRLRRLRQERGLTLIQLAQTAGVSRSALNRWETGVNEPRLPELDAVLMALGAPPQERREILSEMDAPRAAAVIQTEISQQGEQSGIGPMPHGGDLLRAMRLRRDLSLEELASRLKVTTRTLRLWENAEVWPTVEQLHRLCCATGAHESEFAALIGGRFLPLIVRPENGAGRRASDIDALYARLTEIRRLMDSGERALTELQLLSLEAQIWPLAARRAAGAQRLLAEAYTLHSRYFRLWNRYRESRKYADDALLLLPEKAPLDPCAVEALLQSIEGEAHSGGRHARNHALKRLQYLSPLIRDDAKKSGAHSLAGSLLSSEPSKDESLTRFHEALTLAERNATPGLREGRRHDYAAGMIPAGKPGAALDLLEGVASDIPFLSVGLCLIRTDAHQMLGDKSAAHDWLQQAMTTIEALDLSVLRTNAEILARRM